MSGIAPKMDSLAIAHQALPALYTGSPQAARRTLEFFTASIRNAHTRRAYLRAAADFSRFCVDHGMPEIQHVQPVHVAAWVELQLQHYSKPTVKQQLAAVRMLFDSLVVGQVIPTNPAASVRGPRHSVKKGKTPVLTADEARTLLDTVDTSTALGRRDRALLGLMVYTFARVGAVVKMRAEDVYLQGRRTWVRLQEKGGKQHEMPCHHNLDEYLHAYLEAAPGPAKGFLFRTAAGRTGQLTDNPMTQSDVYRMIGRRAASAGIGTKIGCHSFRATGITEYLRNGGKVEVAQQMANHESARTTGLYDRRNDVVSLDEIERIVI